MKVLLKHGANVHLKDARGMSVLHMLVDENMKLVDLLDRPSVEHSPILAIFEDEDTKKCNYNREFKELKFVEFDGSNIVQEKLELNKKMIQLLIEWNATNDWKIIDDTGLSNLHVACCFQDLPMIKQLLKSVKNLDHCINIDSHVYPGYTALHFAAHVDVNVVKFLLSHGANILAKDATGTTPFDLCLAKYNFHQITSIIDSQTNWKNILFTDGKTKLLDFISSMKKTSCFNSFLKNVDVNIAIPHDSTLWPGYTLLHLSITLCQRNSDKKEVQKIKKLLDLGADVTVRNARGWTPLHLAFYENKSIVFILLEQHPDNVNPVDENGFSHLHIACIREIYLEKFLNGPNINSSVKSTFTVRKSDDIDTREIHVSAGSTPLHVALVNNNYFSREIMIELIEHGADICSKDIDGFTPMHHAFIRQMRCINCCATVWEKVFSTSDLENCVANCGLSHLHVASFAKNAKAVQKMLDLGADINAMIQDTSPKFSIDHEREKEKNPYHSHDVECFARCFAGYTPLEFALDERCDEVVSILLRRGADVLMRKPDGSVLLSKLLQRQRTTFFGEYENDENMHRYIEKETGLTILHIACAAFDFDAVVKSLDRIDVNSPAHSDSPIWPGCTPLHVLVIEGKSCSFYFNARKRVCQLIELLIGKGANLVLQNAEQKTPLHETVDRSPLFRNGYPLALDLAILILKNYEKYDTNPVDARGISHFHIACLCKDVTSVKKFLEHGVDVEQAVDYFVESCAGYTPLHLAAVQKSRETVALLLQNNADVNAKNMIGETPIQTIAFRYGIKKEDLDLFIEAGADINGKDLFGDTPLESLIREQITWDINEIEDTVMNYQCRVNVFYPRRQQGFMGYRFSNGNRTPSRDKIISDPLARTLGPFVRAAINAPKVNDVDFLGRSVIHNIVSADISHLNTVCLDEKYTKAIGELVKAGFDIDHRDRRGYTPLHLAVYLKNSSGIQGLLKNGADWNLLDKKGKPAYAYLESYQVNECEDDFELPLWYTHINLYRHFKKLQILKLHISPANQYIFSQHSDPVENDLDTDKKSSDFLHDVHMATLKTIEPYPIRLHDFLSETGAVSTFVYKSLVEKEVINKFFQTNRAYLYEHFPELVGILYLQYRKAVARKGLIEPANTSLSILSEFDLPHLCSEAVLKFLSNDELKNVIASTSDEYLLSREKMYVWKVI